VRIVGPGFELVRSWAEQSIPLSIVFRGIEQKAERHRHGASNRPLRIEFCSDDVRATFEQWRRAVGVSTAEAAPGAEAAVPKAPSLGRHLDRAIDRLSRFCGREDTPADLRDAVDGILQSLASLRESSVRARGSARDEAIARLASLDADLGAAVSAHAPGEWVASLRDDAVRDLEPFRSRLDPGAWERSINITVDRLLRDRFGLPHLEL
jgi:hypothetical protein